MDNPEQRCKRVGCNHYKYRHTGPGKSCVTTDYMCFSIVSSMCKCPGFVE